MDFNEANGHCLNDLWAAEGGLSEGQMAAILDVNEPE